MANRAEVLAALGIKKTPELVNVKGKVAPSVAEIIRTAAADAGVSEEEVAGVALTDWAKKLERKLAKADKAEA